MWTQKKVYTDSPRKYLEAQEKKQPKNPLSFYVLQEVCNNLWKNCAYWKVRQESFKVSGLFFPTQYFHYLHKLLPPCSKISCDGLHLLLHAALLLPLPPAYSGLISQHSLLHPQPSAHLIALRRMVPQKPDKVELLYTRAPGGRQSMTICTLC